MLRWIWRIQRRRSGLSHHFCDSAAYLLEQGDVQVDCGSRRLRGDSAQHSRHSRHCRGVHNQGIHNRSGGREPSERRTHQGLLSKNFFVRSPKDLLVSSLSKFLERTRIVKKCKSKYDNF